MSSYAIRQADTADVQALYNLGASIPQLNVGGETGGFLSNDQIEDSILSQDVWVVLLHEKEVGADVSIVGLCYAKIGDTDSGIDGGACIVYLGLAAEHRGKGHGSALLIQTIERLKSLGVQSVYGWANSTSGAVDFMEQHGFARGKTCVWVDKKL